jgi:hypothetical protein
VLFIGKAKMMDTVLAYFSENIDKISKEEILQALRNALLSAAYWREACLLGFLTVQDHGPKAALIQAAFPVMGSRPSE